MPNKCQLTVNSYSCQYFVIMSVKSGRRSERFWMFQISFLILNDFRGSVRLKVYSLNSYFSYPEGIHGPILNLFGPSPTWFGISNFSRSWSELVLDYHNSPVLVRFGSRTRTEPLGPGPISFGPSILDIKCDDRSISRLNSEKLRNFHF